MITLALVVLAWIVGLILGWFGRTIRDYLRVIAADLNEKRNEIVEKRTDKSGVVRPGVAYKRGDTIPLPDYNPDESTIVRAPAPELVKARSDADFKKVVDSYRTAPPR